MIQKMATEEIVAGTEQEKQQYQTSQSQLLWAASIRLVVTFVGRSTSSYGMRF